MGKIKQVIILRRDLNMRLGKSVSQGAHASMAAILNMGRIGPASPLDIVGSDYSLINDQPYELSVSRRDNPDIYDWVTGSFTKICVGVESEVQLRALIKLAEEAGLPAALMTDDGTTEFAGVSTVTAGAVGPGDSDVIDLITGHLKLL